MKIKESSFLARETFAFVLAGGKGTRLYELTEKRAKPAVYFGGKSRIIDFALSNALNSGIRRIGVATQYSAHSLIRHLHRGWNFFRSERNESFDIMPASQQASKDQWYQGTADAVYQNIDRILGHNVNYVLVLAGDHIYKMDYEKMLQDHVQSGADITVGCIEVPVEEAKGFGVIHVDENDVVEFFVEKPEQPPEMISRPGFAMASMGIYVFQADRLREILDADALNPNSSHDFGKDIIPLMVQQGKVQAHRFTNSCVRSEEEPQSEYYWRDVGTLDAYWEANIDLTDVIPKLDIYDRNWPIWTYTEMGPPAKFVHDIDGRRGTAVSSMVSNNCIISGASIRRALLFSNVRINSYSDVEDAVLMPWTKIGRNCSLKKVIIDKGVTIPEGLVVGKDPEFDQIRFRRTSNGVCLITQPMLDGLQKSDL